MENLGGWDHSEDHPDFDPNLLNVESWGVDSHSHQPNDKPRSHSKKKRHGSWGDQWSNLGVADFDHHEVNVNVNVNINPAAGETIARKHGHNDDAVNVNVNNGVNPNNPNAMRLGQSSGVVGIPNETVEAAVASVSETSDSVNSSNRSGGSSVNNIYSSVSVTQHLHPLGIQSSASCPSPVHADGNPNINSNTNAKVGMAAAFQQQMQQQSRQEQNLHQGLCSMDLSQALERSVARHTGLPMAATARTTTPTICNTSANTMANTTQHLSSLAANFMLAQGTDSSVAASFLTAAGAAATVANVSSGPVIGASTQDHKHQQQQQQQHHDASVVTQPSIFTSSNVNNSKPCNTSRAVSNRQRGNGTRPRQPRATSKTKKKKTNGSTNPNAGAAASTLPPPFYLFDAPIELRANFMQNQRRLGLPIQHDPNSYHYGETVNGFHPHQYQLPFGATAAAATGGSPPRPPHNGLPPQLIDARHGNYCKSKNGQVKNEREQKRAQKITELIEQLRLQMEEGGWQVEARSKFHTLSNCAQYIKHMIKLTTDKENDNSKLNADLDEKRHKLEREKEESAMQEGRSDPESTTSSLTSDTTMSTARHKQEEETSGESGGDDTKKRKFPENRSREGGSSGDDSNNDSNKKHRMISSEATSEDSSGDDNRGGGSGSGNSGSGGPSAQGCSISKTISTVSELTDSNRGSSSNNSGSGGGSSDDVPTEQDSRESTSRNGEAGEDQPSNSSISSDAAVASEKTSRDRNTGHKDVVFSNDQRMRSKRPPEEITSLERSFELNYEEVFDKSNIPQLIASTSGKIMTWNECFAKATGYRKSEIERMTIFSLVKPENLANFFEIVAAALRPYDEETTKENIDEGSSDDTSEKKKETEESNNSYNTDVNRNAEDKMLKQSAVSASISTSDSSHDRFCGRDTVICSNNDKVTDNTKKNENTISHQVTTEKKVESPWSTNSEEQRDEGHTVSGNSTTEESGEKLTEEQGLSESNAYTIFDHSDKETVQSSGTSNEQEVSITNNRDNVSGNSNSETCDSSSGGAGTESSTVRTEESPNNITNTDERNKYEGGKKSKREVETESMPRRLLNYTAMTLPCIDFPSMIKWNQAAAETNSVIIPPLHVTVTLMPDKDPRRRCFHCVFTNFKGTNGSLGIITPDLLASLFAKPLRSSRRKKRYYSSHIGNGHQHQRKRARGGTTRVGQSVSTANNEEQEHCFQQVSTNEIHESSPSP